jgi:abhydrolase domain-containing protein 12
MSPKEREGNHRPDKERIFVWHVLPFEKEAIGGKEGEHLQILQNDKTARVIIYCRLCLLVKLTSVHGTASHVGQELRLDVYRLLTASNPNTHLFAMDYRGWGYSSGRPTEEGVTTDGMAVLNWVINTANVDPSQILIVSQSLGTGISMGVVSQYHDLHPDRPLAGTVMIASFTSLRKLVGGYRMAGIIPLLGPLRVIPRARDYFVDKCLRADFNSAERILRLARLTRGTKFSISLVHATNDWEISFLHSRELFSIACDGETLIHETVYTDKVIRSIEQGRIRHIETSWGGHNDIQKSDTVVKAVLSAWR